MTKKNPEQQADEAAGGILGSAHQIWLAGLGAFAKAEQEGSRFFESLVREGEKVEARARQAAEDKVEEVKNQVGETVEEVKEKATDTWDSLEQAFEERVARVLNRLGVPTYEDIQGLAKRVEELNDSVKALTKKSSASGQSK